MPLHEVPRGRRGRDKWPLEFDLEGVPRDTTTRKQKLAELKVHSTLALDEAEEQSMSPVTNSFVSDKGSLVSALNLTPAQKQKLMAELQQEMPVGREIDLNKPQFVPNPHLAFPQMLYHHKTGHLCTVADEAQFKLAKKKGFEEKPSPDFDYSRLTRVAVLAGGLAILKAAPALTSNLPESPLSAEDLAELEKEEA